MATVGQFLLRFLRCLMTAFSLCTVFQFSHPKFLLSLVLSAFVGAICWPMLEQRYGAERTLYISLLPIRYGMAFIVAIYGFAKLFGLQFFTPLATLDTPLGYLSGFELAWRFFGYSPTYAYFIAVAQILGSLLLLSRRTTTLGTLLLIPIFINIVLINFGFGIPVTFFSSVYLILGIYLLVPDLSRLYRMLVLNLTVESRPTISFFAKPGHQRIANIIKAVVVCLIYMLTLQGMRTVQKIISRESAITGAWKIELSQSVAASIPWKKVYFERGGWGSFRDAGGNLQWFISLVNEHEQSLELYFLGEEEPAIVAHYDRADDEMVLTGNWNDRPFSVRLDRFEVERRR